jgi:4-aminobutyrate aminotransferase-like enzyme
MIDGLRALAAKHELIGDVRGSGLLIGVEMVRDRACKTPASEETARVVQRHAPAPGNQRDGA